MNEPAIRAHGDAWSDLLDGLTLLRRGAIDDISPLHCEHDTLRVMADAAQFTPGEIDQLDEWGFFVDGEGVFLSFRFGSA